VVSLGDVSLALALMRLFQSLLRGLIRLLHICRLSGSLILDWLKMIFKLLARGSGNSAKPRHICSRRFFRGLAWEKSVFIRILLLIYLIASVLVGERSTTLYGWLPRFV
jgi:hypothetical protein